MLLANAIATVSGHDAAIEERSVTSQLAITEDCMLLADDRQFSLSEHGFEQLCGRISAPAPYLRSLDLDVRQSVLQRHIARGDLDSDRLTVISRGNEFLGFGRADLLRISGREAFEAIQEGVSRDIEVSTLKVQGESVHADLLVENALAEVAPGDILRAGLQVTHSLIGDHATWIEAYILRLQCANGMTHRECVSARTRRLPIGHKDARQMQIAQVRRLAADTASALEKKLATIRELRDQPVDVDRMLTRWLDRARLSTRRWLPVALNAWETEGGEATAYGLMNALTRIATHGEGISARQRRIFSGLAGLLAFQRVHICPRCFSQLGGPSSHGESGDVAAEAVDSH